MNRHTNKGGAVVFLVPLLVLLFVSCNTGSNDRPWGWDNATHGSKADADYSVVFAQDKVKRIDLVFKSRDWQAMLDDMTDLVGEFGAGGGFGGGGRPGGGTKGPEEMIKACEGLQQGDSCKSNDNDSEQNGTCQTMSFLGQQLVCLPEMFSACEGLQEGDTCRFHDNGTEVSGTCQSIPMMGQMLCRTKDDNGGAPGGGGGGGLDMLAREPAYQPCTFVFEGTTWWHVGVRFKGNSSLLSTWSSGVYKLPIRLDFDQYEDEYPEITNQRFYGFQKLTLASNWSDTTLIREKVVADIFREAGVPAPITAFYRLYINFGKGPVYFGLYTMVEDPDGPMLDRQFKDSSGNLYKPEGSGANFVKFDEDSFAKKTNEDEADWSDVISVFGALHADRSDAAVWRSGLEQVFDVNGFLHWLAVNTVITNWDTYGSMAHNYYLYNDPDDSLLHWIPWDNNMALMNMGDMFMGGMGAAVPLNLSSVGDNWPLIRYLADDPVYRAAYRAFVNETLQGVFTTEKNRVRFQAAHDLIEPYVVGAAGEQEGYTLLSNPNDFYTGFDNLTTYAEQRRTAALQFLTDEGFRALTVDKDTTHAHPSSAQADGIYVK